MSSLLRRIKGRLSGARGTQGFTLGELMVAVLVMGLVSVLLVTGVALSARQYQQSVAGSESRALCSTLTTALTSALRSADDFANPRTTVEGGVEHYAYGSFWASGAYRTGVVALGETDAPLPDGTPGFLALQATDGGVAKLVPASAYTWGMSARAELDWNNGGGRRYDADHPVCDVTLTVCDGDGSQVARTCFTVVPVNS